MWRHSTRLHRRLLSIFRTGFAQARHDFEFIFLNKDAKLDEIGQTLKNGHDPSEIASDSFRHSRAALFVSFTAYLSRLSGSLIQKAVVQKNGANKTYSHVKTKTCATLLWQSNYPIFQCYKWDWRRIKANVKSRSKILTLKWWELYLSQPKKEVLLPRLSLFTFQQNSWKNSRHLLLALKNTAIFITVIKYIQFCFQITNAILTAKKSSLEFERLSFWKQ